MGAVYGPYEVNKKRIGNKSLKFTKHAMVFNIQRNTEIGLGNSTGWGSFSLSSMRIRLGTNKIAKKLNCKLGLRSLTKLSLFEFITMSFTARRSKEHLL